jgi:aryl-alcohol dehydrogenase-like predicted oxidoreductase
VLAAGTHSKRSVRRAWIIAQGQHGIPIPGTQTPKYLAENAGAGQLILDPDTVAELDALPAPAGNRY